MFHKYLWVEYIKNNSVVTWVLPLHILSCNTFVPFSKNDCRVFSHRKLSVTLFATSISSVYEISVGPPIPIATIVTLLRTAAAAASRVF